VKSGIAAASSEEAGLLELFQLRNDQESCLDASAPAGLSWLVTGPDPFDPVDPGISRAGWCGRRQPATRRE
jgi:hypothetical protein